MKLFVRTLTGKVIELKNIKPDALVDDVALALVAQEGGSLDPYRMRIIWAGRALLLGQRLNEIETNVVQTPKRNYRKLDAAPPLTTDPIPPSATTNDIVITVRQLVNLGHDAPNPYRRLPAADPADLGGPQYRLVHHVISVPPGDDHATAVQLRMRIRDVVARSRGRVTLPAERQRPIPSVWRNITIVDGDVLNVDDDANLQCGNRCSFIKFYNAWAARKERQQEDEGGNNNDDQSQHNQQQQNNNKLHVVIPHIDRGGGGGAGAGEQQQQDSNNNALNGIFEFRRGHSRLGVRMFLDKRFPEDGQQRDLTRCFPPAVARVQDHASRCPRLWAASPGLITGLYQCESLWFELFNQQHQVPERSLEALLRVQVNGQNAMSGNTAFAGRRLIPEPRTDREGHAAIQDYMVMGAQRFLAGFPKRGNGAVDNNNNVIPQAAGDGDNNATTMTSSLRSGGRPERELQQFVAPPYGTQYTATPTASDFTFQCIPLFKHRTCFISVHGNRVAVEDLNKTPHELQLAVGSTFSASLPTCRRLTAAEYMQQLRDDGALPVSEEGGALIVRARYLDAAYDDHDDYDFGSAPTAARGVPDGATLHLVQTMRGPGAFPFNSFPDRADALVLESSMTRADSGNVTTDEPVAPGAARRDLAAVDLTDAWTTQNTICDRGGLHKFADWDNAVSIAIHVLNREAWAQVTGGDATLGRGAGTGANGATGSPFFNDGGVFGPDLTGGAEGREKRCPWTPAVHDEPALPSGGGAGGGAAASSASSASSAGVFGAMQMCSASDEIIVDDESQQDGGGAGDAESCGKIVRGVRFASAGGGAAAGAA